MTPEEMALQIAAVAYAKSLLKPLQELTKSSIQKKPENEGNTLIWNKSRLSGGGCTRQEMRNITGWSAISPYDKLAQCPDVKNGKLAHYHTGKRGQPNIRHFLLTEEQAKNSNLTKAEPKKPKLWVVGTE